MPNLPTTDFRYKDFASVRLQVANILKQLSDSFKALDAAKRAASLANTRESLLDDTFRVLVLGEFSRGKSTLINAMLSEPVLPAKIAPCTAVITRLCFGERKRARLIYRDGRVEEIDLVLMPDELKRRITIAEGTKSTIEVCEIYYPLDLLRNGVELVDSPGLNESDVHTDITKAFFDRTDAIILVLNCEQAFTHSEKSFLEFELRDRDLRDVFFVWNRFDIVRDSPEDVDDLMKLSATKLESKVGGRSRVFYISAKDALLGRMRSDPSLIDRSSIVPFEKALEDFLANERGRVKLRGPVKIAETTIAEGLEKLIPNRESLIRKPIDQLRSLFEQQKPRLEAAERQQERILRTIDRRSESVEREASSLIQGLVLDLESVVERMLCETEIGVWDAVARQQTTSKKILERMENAVNVLIQNWQRAQFQPAIESSFSELELDLNDELGELMTNLDALDLEIGGDSQEQRSPSETALSRLVLSNTAISDNELAGLLHFASAGTGNILAGVGLSVAAYVGIAILSFPITAIGLILGAIGGAGAFWGGQRRADEIRKTIMDQVSGALRNDVCDRMVTEAARKISEAILKVKRELQNRMAIRIDEVRGQVESVLRDKEKHEADASSQLEIIANARICLERLSKDVESISQLLPDRAK